MYEYFIFVKDYLSIFIPLNTTEDHEHDSRFLIINFEVLNNSI